MKRHAAALVAVTLLVTGCSDAPELLAPTSPTAPVLASASTMTVTSYSQPFNSVLLNACSGQEVTLSGTQTFTVTEHTQKTGRSMVTMQGVIDGIATAADGSTSAFTQDATTSTRQASPDDPIVGKSSYTFEVAGDPTFIVRVRTEFVYDPATGIFTTTGSSEKSDCR